MANPSFRFDVNGPGNRKQPPGFFTPPRLPLGHVPRPRLTRLIQSPYLTDLTLITGEAGTGKTTLTTEWAQLFPGVVAWITLGDEIQNSSALATAILTSLKSTTCHSAPSALPNRVDPMEALAAMARSLDHDACVVIDNWHSPSDPGLASMVESLLAIPRSRLRLVIAGRSAPSLRLARLRAHGRVRELGPHDLSLSRPEAEAIIRANAQFEISPAHLDWLVETADGWVAGLMLLLQKVGHGTVGPLHLAGDGPPNPALDEFVEQEILSPLASEVRAFMLAASNLPWIAEDICGETSVTPLNAGQLNALVPQVPFVRPDPDHPHRLRLHSLVRESVRRLASAKTPDPMDDERRRRLATWLIREGELEEAARVALEMTDLSEMAIFLEPLCRHLAERSHFEALHRWLSRVPEPVFSKNRDLAWWWFIAQAGTLRLPDAAASLEKLEPPARASGNPLDLGRILLAHGGLLTLAGQQPEARQLLLESLGHLPENALPEKMYAATMLGELAFRQGRDVEAARAFRRAEQFATRHPHDELWSRGILAPGRANGYALRGDVNSAITMYRLIISEIPHSLEQTGVDCLVRCRLVNLYIERNELDAAREELERLEPEMHDRSRAWSQEARIAKARLLIAEERCGEAEEWICDQLGYLNGMPGRSQLVHILANMWLRRGEYPMVEGWLAEVSTLEPPDTYLFGDIDYRLISIDLAIAQGRYEDAVAATRNIVRVSALRKRMADLIALSVRQAVALRHLGQADSAENVFKTTLNRGATKGFVRSFAVSGEDTIVMFADIWSQKPEYRAILHSLHAGHRQEASGASLNISGREREVLLLVTKGLTNKQVANDLFISPNTVRNHLVRICQRLNAHTRSEAVARAIRLGLLD